MNKLIIFLLVINYYFYFRILMDNDVLFSNRVALVIQSILCYVLFCINHEMMHYNVFINSYNLENMFGYFNGFILQYGFNGIKIHHLLHHKYEGHAEFDPDIWTENNIIVTILNYVFRYIVLNSSVLLDTDFAIKLLMNNLNVKDKGISKVIEKGYFNLFSFQKLLFVYLIIISQLFPKINLIYRCILPAFFGKMIAILILGWIPHYYLKDRKINNKLLNYLLLGILNHEKHHQDRKKTFVDLMMTRTV